METKFQPTNDTPLAALTIGQFKELVGSMIQPQPIIQSKENSLEEYTTEDGERHPFTPKWK